MVQEVVNMKRLFVFVCLIMIMSCSSSTIFIRSFSLSDEVIVEDTRVRVLSIDTIDVYGGESRKRVIFEKVAFSR